MDYFAGSGKIRNRHQVGISTSSHRHSSDTDRFDADSTSDLPARYDSRRLRRRTFLQLAAAATCAGGDQTVWRAGAATTDITPREPIWMAGYAARTHPSEGVRQPLFVKALALEDQTGAKSVIVTSDLQGFPPVVAEPIVRECQAKPGLSREHLVLKLIAFAQRSGHRRHAAAGLPCDD
jgi:hypothetical protein